MEDRELNDWMHDLFEMTTKAEVLAALKAQDIETRKEALREAAEAVRRNAGYEDENGIAEGVSNWPDASARTYSFATHEAIEAIRALAKEDN